MSTTKWRGNLASLRETLVAAQAVRSERPGLATLADGSSELEWVLYERTQMLAAVNALREHAGKRPISVAAVVAAETRAMGHVDYTTKFAIGCAELVAADDAVTG